MLIPFMFIDDAVIACILARRVKLHYVFGETGVDIASDVCSGCLPFLRRIMCLHVEYTDIVDATASVEDQLLMVRLRVRGRSERVIIWQFNRADAPIVFSHLLARFVQIPP